MAVTVRIATAFQRFTSGAEEIFAEPACIRDIIMSIDKAYPGLADAVLFKGEIKPNIIVFLNDLPVNSNSMACDGDEISIVPIVVGG